MYSYERFTERARQVVVLAQDEARNHSNTEITHMHILAGLIREEKGIAARVLNRFDTAHPVLLENVRGWYPPYDPGCMPGVMPMSDEAKKVHELALREALSLGHNYIGTEHILLGFVKAAEQYPEIQEFLNSAAITADKVRLEIIRALAGPGRDKLKAEVRKERVYYREPSIAVLMGEKTYNISLKEAHEIYEDLGKALAQAR